MPHFNCWDSIGRIRRDITEDELAALEPDQRAAFLTLCQAMIGEDEASASFETAERQFHASVKTRDAAHEALLRITPKPTFYDVWKKDIAKIA